MDPALRPNRHFWWVASLCSMLPDIDAIGLRMGVPYADLWGHRGMTHSLFCAAVLGILAAAYFRQPWRQGWKLASLLFVVTASHGALDALTNGGLGVAFFSPFDPHRYFFPWRPIQVSPIGAHAFLGARGMSVLLSEICWVWGAALFLFALPRAVRRWRRAQSMRDSGTFEI